MPRRPHHPLIFLVLAFLLSQATAQADAPTPTPPPRLLFVAELCRHGDRAPLKQFPNDALPASKWPEGIGELTAVGQRAHFALGQRLRARYVDTQFLPEAFDPKHVYVRSTDIDRTLASAVSQMAGLYPPGSAPNSDVRIRYGQDPLHENEGGLPHLYQPVPVHTTSKNTDMLLIPGANCPRHEYIMRQKRNSKQFENKIADERAFLDKAATIAGADKSNFTIFDLEHLSDTWTCFAAHSVPLPDGATPEVVSHARNLSNWLLTFGNEGLEVNRLRAGLILHEIKFRMVIAALQDVKKLPPAALPLAKKFMLLSAHDTTVAATLSALQVFDGVNPPYNSTLIWELFRASNGTLLVRIEYNDNPVRVPGCSNEYCNIEEYLASTVGRTVAGEGARFVECLTGWRRYASMATNYFRKQPDDWDVIGTFKSQGESSGSSDVNVVAIIVIILIAAAMAIAALVRVFVRYKGYVPAAGHEGLISERGMRRNQDSVSDRPILM